MMQSTGDLSLVNVNVNVHVNPMSSPLPLPLPMSNVKMSMTKLVGMKNTLYCSICNANKHHYFREKDKEIVLSKNFCQNKADGKYTNPKNPQQFFTCTDNVGSLCQLCPPGLVYRPKCDQCIIRTRGCSSKDTKKAKKHILY